MFRSNLSRRQKHDAFVAFCCSYPLPMTTGVWAATVLGSFRASVCLSFVCLSSVCLSVGPSASYL